MGLPSQATDYVFPLSLKRIFYYSDIIHTLLTFDTLNKYSVEVSVNFAIVHKKRRVIHIEIQFFKLHHISHVE